MKRKIVTLCFLLLMTAGTQAQYVLIPDSIFRHELITLGYATCFDTTQTMLDTTCSTVLASTELIVDHKFIRSVEGVQYFKNLIHLDCYGNYIDSISHLPPLLKYFNCSVNHIEKIPVLPGLLDTLNCYDNQLDSLPALSNPLSYLYCAVNPIGRLPALPGSLTTLICFGNHLDSLPALPSSLSYFNCGGNFITSLPILPDSLAYFDCSGNTNLQCLPYLNKIVWFRFLQTAITCLPNAPSDNTYINPANVPICTAPCYPSGINNLSGNEADLKIYPNPATDKLYIDYSQGALFTVSDLTGRILVLPTTNTEIDVSALPAGVYCLRVQDSSGSVLRKFVKEP